MLLALLFRFREALNWKWFLHFLNGWNKTQRLYIVACQIVWNSNITVHKVLLEHSHSYSFDLSVACGLQRLKYWLALCPTSCWLLVLTFMVSESMDRQGVTGRTKGHFRGNAWCEFFLLLSWCWCSSGSMLECVMWSLRETPLPGWFRVRCPSHGKMQDH